MGNGPSSSSGHRGSSSRRQSSKARRQQEHQNELADRARQVVGESVRELQAGIQSGIKRLEDQDHPAAQLIDTLCSPILDGESDHDHRRHNRHHHRGGGGRSSEVGSYYSEDVSEEEEEDSRTISEDETTLTDYQRSRRNSRSKDRDSRHHIDEQSLETRSYQSQSDGYESSTVVTAEERAEKSSSSGQQQKSDKAAAAAAAASSSSLVKQPLASSFAKRCFFTKQGIGGQTQHYEGLTLTGNVVLMLAAAMKLKGCPTICDEDLRRVEQTYPNQFSRLPDELLLSSGWRRISKYCHFSNKPIPDGSPFFHSRQRLHPSGGYYFLLAAAVGMVRPIDVEPLTRDTLVLLETDYPTTCDNAPDILNHDPDQWTLVDKFCFFSGGPINTDEDVYYQADFDGNPIYMLAFLSPSLTPAELYKLDADPHDPGLKSVAGVEEVESVYDLTDRDFDDLKLYHLGPCRALPQYILQPQAWTKVLPPHFLSARQTAMLRAQDYEHRLMQQQQQQQQQQHLELHHNLEEQHLSQQQYQQPLQLQPQPQDHHLHEYPEEYQQPGGPPTQQQPLLMRQSVRPMQMNQPYDDEEEGQLVQDAIGEEEALSYYEEGADHQEPFDNGDIHHHGHASHPIVDSREFARQVEEEGAFLDDDNIPMDEAIAAHAAAVAAPLPHDDLQQPQQQHHQRMDPPEDEPPSLSKQREEQQQQQQMNAPYYSGFEENAGEYYDEEFYESKENGKYYATSTEESQESLSVNEEEEEVVVEQEDVPEEEHDEEEEEEMHMVQMMAESPERDASMGRRNPELPPVSPRSPSSEALSPQSSAMREAQDMIRRNRQRRSVGNTPTDKLEPQEMSTDTDPMECNPVTSPNTDSESGTWESGSDFTGSSAWTDNDSQQAGCNDQRSSRRALILQMAKARMKSNKTHQTSTTPTSGHGYSSDGKQEEEKKADGVMPGDVDLDLTEDLD